MGGTEPTFVVSLSLRARLSPRRWQATSDKLLTFGFSPLGTPYTISLQNWDVFSLELFSCAREEPYISWRSVPIARKALTPWLVP